MSTGGSINKIIDNFQLIKLPQDALVDENLYERFKVDEWLDYDLASGVKSTVELAEKKIKSTKINKDDFKYRKIEKLLEELKLAVIHDNEELVEKYDEELTDILFEE
ncbi:hypothetical protein SDC9_185036 [bioreactor metagenome]|uniref:Uncharacterized protein n=1 Tax=bioreactor metagenome TaxID=1076179 RepID=A0A645HEP7_9ZZZZ